MSLIDVRDVYKIYNLGENEVRALDGVDFSVKTGEFVSIIGKSGSGKSTLIQHLNALIPLQSGQLFVGDFDLSCKDKDYKKRLQPCTCKG